jgi:glycosyltransferase involved in cell wall biosynthesis
LTVGIDATPLAAAPVGGLARYTRQLVEALAHEFADDQFVLVSDQPFQCPPACKNVRTGARPANLLERRWWTFGLPRELKRQGVDVFHGVDFAVPFPPTVPALMTIHDLSPWHTGAWVDEAWRARAARVRKRVPWMIRTGAAGHIVTPSEAIRREVIRSFHVDARRVTAIPLAAATHFRPQEPVAGRPYFLFAGMLEPRKNVAGVLEAWTAVRAEHEVDLVLAGPHREDFHLPPPQPGLHRRGVVSEDELARLYAGAVALVYPSHYEGFGLPVLEAMQCGTPAVISDDPALVETAGDAALQAQSSVELAAAMRALLENPTLRDELARRALARAGRFSWQRTARATHALYRSMLAA